MACFTRRVVQLYLGLALYGLAIALQLESGLGNDPWDVFHQGLAPRLGLSIGLCVSAVGVAVLLMWIPLRQRPGIGTVSNALVLGLFADAFLALLPAPNHWLWQWTYLVTAVVGGGLATALYIGAGLGPGPRDGLSTGLARRSGYSLRSVRTVIELTVLAVGIALGGQAGIGTVLYAFAIGPLSQAFLKWLTVAPPVESSVSLPREVAIRPNEVAHGQSQTG